MFQEWTSIYDFEVCIGLHVASGSADPLSRHLPGGLGLDRRLIRLISLTGLGEPIYAWT